MFIRILLLIMRLVNPMCNAIGRTDAPGFLLPQERHGKGRPIGSPLLVVTRQRRIRRYIKWRGNLAPTACCAATMDLGTDEGVCTTDYGSIFIMGRPSWEGRPYVFGHSPPQADAPTIVLR